MFQGHLPPQPWAPTAVAGPALAAQLPQRCLRACSCKPCGREGMHKDVAPAGPAEQDAQRHYHKKQTLPESSECESRGASMQGPAHIGRFVGQIISLRGVWLSASYPLPGERFDSPRHVSDSSPQSFHWHSLGGKLTQKVGPNWANTCLQNTSQKATPTDPKSVLLKCPKN